MLPSLLLLPWAIVNYNDCNCVTSVGILIDVFLEPLKRDHQILGYSIYTSPLRCTARDSGRDSRVILLSENYSNPETGSTSSTRDANSIGRSFVQGVRDFYDKHRDQVPKLSGFLLMNDDTFFRSKTMNWNHSWITAERDVILTDISSGNMPRHANTWPDEKSKFYHWRQDVFDKMQIGLGVLKTSGLLQKINYSRMRAHANGQDDVVSFHQVDLFYIDAASVDRFVVMITPFVRLGMNPEIYVPYIFRMMYPPCPPNFFVMPHRSRFGPELFKRAAGHSGFFGVHGVKLLKRCTPPVIDNVVVELIKKFI